MPHSKYQGREKLIYNPFGEILKHLKQSLNSDKDSYVKMCLIVFGVCKVHLEMVKVTVALNILI